MERSQSIAAVFGLIMMLHYRCSAQENGTAVLTSDAPNASVETEFFIVFMEHDSSLTPRYINVNVYVSNPTNRMVQAAIFYKGLHPYTEGPIYENITAGDTLILNVTTSMILQGATKHNKCVIITTVRDVIVQANSYISVNRSSAGGFSVLPSSALTANYIVATYCSENKKCVFAVTSVEDDNEVTITFRIEEDKKAEYKNNYYVDDNITSESLNRGESMQIVCKGCDMTGTLVSASKRVAVVGGGQHTKRRDTGGKRDRVLEQMMPVETLGHHYVLERYPAGVSNEVKVVVLKAGTWFFFNEELRNSTRDREVFSFKRNSHELTEIFSVGVEGLLVVQVLQVFNESRHMRFDLVMILPVPVHLWRSSYRVYVPVTHHESNLFLVMTEGAESVVNVSAQHDKYQPQFFRESNYTSAIYWLTTDGAGIVDVSCPDREKPCPAFTGSVIYSIVPAATTAVTLRYFDWDIPPDEYTIPAQGVTNTYDGTIDVAHRTSEEHLFHNTVTTATFYAEISTPPDSEHTGGFSPNEDVSTGVSATADDVDSNSTTASGHGSITGSDVNNSANTSTSFSAPLFNVTVGNAAGNDVTVVSNETSLAPDAENRNTAGTDVTVVSTETSGAADAEDEGAAGNGVTADNIKVMSSTETANDSDAESGNNNATLPSSDDEVDDTTGSVDTAKNGVIVVSTGTSLIPDTAGGKSAGSNVTVVSTGTSPAPDAEDGHAAGSDVTVVNTKPVFSTEAATDSDAGNDTVPSSDATVDDTTGRDVIGVSTPKSLAPEVEGKNSTGSDVSATDAGTSLSSDTASGHTAQDTSDGKTDTSTRSTVPGHPNPTTPKIKTGSTTTVSSTNRPYSKCRCVQDIPAPPLSSEARARIIQESAEAIEKELLVEKSTLSARVRAKTSAEDRRASATVCGAWLCIVSFGVVFGIIAGADLLSLIKYLLECRSKRNEKRCGRDENSAADLS